MAKISRLAGSTSHILTVFIQDATSTTGAGLTGLAFNSAGLACYYKRNRGAASVAVTLANITTLGTYVSGGFKEIDAANLPGFYEFHPPDAGLASGSGSVAFLLRGAANMVPCPVEVELTATDNQDGAAGGISRIDAAMTSRLPTSGYTAPDNATIAAIAGYVDTEVAAIKAKTDNLPASFPTNFAGLAVDSSGRMILQPSGLDAVPGIGTMNARQQADFTAALLFSIRSGMVAGQAGTVTVKSTDGATTYGTVTYDVNGNITAVNITKANLP